MPRAVLTDVELYYEVAGQGELVLLLPGMGATCRLLDPILVGLHEENFCLISVDTRGVGQSVAHRPARTLHHYASDLIELLDHLQVERAHVVGISLGGIIAQRLAMEHPMRLARLVLISCSHQFGPYLREMALMLGNMLRHLSRDQFARTLEMLVAGPCYIDQDPGRLDRKVDEVRSQHISQRDIARQLRALGASDPRPEEYHIVHPTLVVAGECDRLIPPRYQREMARAIDHSLYLLIHESGHNPLVECPHTLLPVICQFLRTGDVSLNDPRFELACFDHGKEIAGCVG